MKLHKHRIRRAKFYGIGYISCIEKYVMYCVIKDENWQSRYYEITEEEYDLYSEKPKSLDEIADKFLEQGAKGKGFLFSDDRSENSKKQNAILDECLEDEKNTKIKYIYF